MKTVTFEIIDFPTNWEDIDQISCLALGKTFPHHNDIPDNPNPRKANVQQPVYKAIVQTLLDEPDKFHELNMGVIIYADIEHVEFKSKVTKVTVRFREKPEGETNQLGQGHSDGRHTILALHDAVVRRAGINLNGVKVPLTIRRWMPTQEDKKKTVLRQKMYQMDRKTLYESADEFAVLKLYIPDTWKVCYYQNQPEVSSNARCDVNYLLQAMGRCIYKNGKVLFCLNTPSRCKERLLQTNQQVAA